MFSDFLDEGDGAFEQAFDKTAEVVIFCGIHDLFYDWSDESFGFPRAGFGMEESVPIPS